MTYIKRSDLQPDEGLVVELDAGDLVLVKQRVKPLSESLCPSIFVSATWVAENLQALLDSAGKPCAHVEFKHTASQFQQDVLTLPVVVRECLWLVLGEPLTLVAPEPPVPPIEDAQELFEFNALHSTTLIPWSNEIVRSVDIRRAIAIAKQGVEVDLDQVL